MRSQVPTLQGTSRQLVVSSVHSEETDADDVMLMMSSMGRLLDISRRLSIAPLVWSGYHWSS